MVKNKKKQKYRLLLDVNSLPSSSSTPSRSSISKKIVKKSDDVNTSSELSETSSKANESVDSLTTQSYIKDDSCKPLTDCNHGISESVALAKDVLTRCNTETESTECITTEQCSDEVANKLEQVTIDSQNARKSDSNDYTQKKNHNAWRQSSYDHGGRYRNYTNNDKPSKDFNRGQRYNQHGYNNNKSRNVYGSREYRSRNSNIQAPENSSLEDKQELGRYNVEHVGKFQGSRSGPWMEHPSEQKPSIRNNTFSKGYYGNKQKNWNKNIQNEQGNWDENSSKKQENWDDNSQNKQDDWNDNSQNKQDDWDQKNQNEQENWDDNSQNKQDDWNDNSRSKQHDWGQNNQNEQENWDERNPDEQETSVENETAIAMRGDVSWDSGDNNSPWDTSTDDHDAGTGLNAQAKTFVPSLPRQEVTQIAKDKEGQTEYTITGKDEDDHFFNSYWRKPEKQERRGVSLGQSQHRKNDSSEDRKSKEVTHNRRNYSEGNNSDQRVKRESRFSFDRSFEKVDAEYRKFQDEERNDNIEFIRVVEIQQDLFAVGKDYSLAHCVAEDMRMGSGIAVTFKRDFKDIDVLLSQREKQGGLAILENKTDEGVRYIYYLVTKRVSTGKPTYQTLWSSLKKMREHIKEEDVRKLAIPRLGCGLDRLEWTTVKHMIEFLFKDVEVEIKVCNFQQNHGHTKQKLQTRSEPSKTKKFKPNKKKK